MTPKEKANELVDKFTLVGLQQRNEGIQCALICVDEMIELLADDSWRNRNELMFYEEVKKQIHAL
jgi:hypothetical protein